MIEFRDLPEVIQAAGPEGASLASLATSLTSKSLVGVLAQRSKFEIRDQILDNLFDLYVCEDRADREVRIPSPFAIVCVDASISGDAQSLFGCIRDQLRDLDLHTRPVLFLYPQTLGGLQPFVDHAQSTVFVPLSSRELVEVMLSHPPRTRLMSRITARTPIKLLNPYVYRGPIGRNMFYGRQQQLKLLTNLTQPSAPSYALVGPRSIGKTSLINRAYEELRQRGEAVIRLEFSATRYEPQLIDQMLAAVSEDLRVRQSSQRSTAVGLLESHVRLAAKNAPSKRVVILLDEADEMQHRCPALADSLRLLHDQGHVRVVLVGYKQLRKDVHNAHKPGLFNVLQPLSLSRLNLHECDELVVYPMTDLQVQITDTAGVVESLFVSSGGGPNRVQLLCHALVNSLENKTARTITAQDAENAIDLPEVRKVVADWYNQSTSKLEKYIAAIAAQVTPCDGEAIIAAVQADAPEIDAETIRTQTQDLITADILDYQRDGKLAFTFPAAKETAFPTAGGSHWLADLRKGVLAKK